MEAQHLHPIFVHFVIAPLTISVIFDLLWLVYKKDLFQIFSWYNCIIAGGMSVIAVVTGLLAEENVIILTTATEDFTLHENFAFLLITVVLMQFFWRFSNKGKIPEKHTILYFILVLSGLIFVFTTSYFGGKLVFEHGIGVKIDNSKQVKPDIQVNKIPAFQFEISDSTKN